MWNSDHTLNTPGAKKRKNKTKGKGGFNKKRPLHLKRSDDEADLPEQIAQNPKLIKYWVQRWVNLAWNPKIIH